MKQTISILAALVIVVLVMTGFIVADYADVNRRLVYQEKELLETHKRLTDSQMEAKAKAKELKTAAEAIEQVAAERDALAQQLKEADSTHQVAQKTAEQQRRAGEKTRLELDMLKTEYLDLLEVCGALETQLAALNTPPAQTAPPRPQLPQTRSEPEPPPANPDLHPHLVTY